jgi:hypothetical protein
VAVALSLASRLAVYLGLARYADLALAALVVSIGWDRV